MTAGVAAKPYASYGWHTYTWAIASAPVDAASGGVWNAFSVTIDADPSALACNSFKTNFDGTVNIRWGERPGAYTGQSPPIPVTAGVAKSYRITQLKRNKTYYVNGYANVAKPGTATTVPQSVIAQYGEVSASTS